MFYMWPGNEASTLQMQLLPRRSNILGSIPIFFRNREAPTVSYCYTNIIASKVFNFKQTMKDLDFDIGTTGWTCGCTTSDYTCKDRGHVITGDLHIIENRKLRNLIEKGPSYTEQNNIDWERNLNCAKKQLKTIREDGQNKK